MKIQDAIDSERKARRKSAFSGWSQWYYFIERGGMKKQLMLIGVDDGIGYPLSKEDIQADDWEVKEQ